MLNTDNQDYKFQEQVKTGIFGIMKNYEYSELCKNNDRVLVGIILWVKAPMFTHVPDSYTYRRCASKEGKEMLYCHHGSCLQKSSSLVPRSQAL